MDPRRVLLEFASSKQLDIKSPQLARLLEVEYGSPRLAAQFNVPSCLDAACGLELAKGMPMTPSDCN